MMQVVVHRSVSVSTVHHALRNQVVIMVKVRRYMKRMEHLISVMSKTYSAAKASQDWKFGQCEV